MSNVTTYRCICPCHGEEFYGVPVTDVVEAAIACDYCKNDHAEVFREPYKAPENWKPENDSTGGDDEGREA